MKLKNPKPKRLQNKNFQIEIGQVLWQYLCRTGLPVKPEFAITVPYLDENLAIDIDNCL